MKALHYHGTSKYFFTHGSLSVVHKENNYSSPELNILIGKTYALLFLKKYLIVCLFNIFPNSKKISNSKKKLKNISLYYFFFFLFSHSLLGFPTSLPFFCLFEVFCSREL